MTHHVYVDREFYDSSYSCTISTEESLSLTDSASRTDLSQLANGIWEIHAGCPSSLRVSSVAKIGYIPQFKASNARDQDEVSSDLARMTEEYALALSFISPMWAMGRT